MVRWQLSGMNLFVPLSESLPVSISLFFFSSSIHVTDDKVQCLCPYIDLCSVWSGSDWDDGAHRHSHTHTLSLILETFRVPLEISVYTGCEFLTTIIIAWLWSPLHRSSAGNACLDVKRFVNFVHLLSYCPIIKERTVSMILVWQLIAPVQRSSHLVGIASWKIFSSIPASFHHRVFVTMCEICVWN